MRSLLLKSKPKRYFFDRQSTCPVYHGFIPVSFVSFVFLFVIHFSEIEAPFYLPTQVGDHFSFLHSLNCTSILISVSLPSHLQPARRESFHQPPPRVKTAPPAEPHASEASSPPPSDVPSPTPYETAPAKTAPRSAEPVPMGRSRGSPTPPSDPVGRGRAVPIGGVPMGGISMEGMARGRGIPSGVREYPPVSQSDPVPVEPEQPEPAYYEEPQYEEAQYEEAQYEEEQYEEAQYDEEQNDEEPTESDYYEQCEEQPEESPSTPEPVDEPSPPSPTLPQNGLRASGPIPMGGRGLFHFFLFLINPQVVVEATFLIAIPASKDFLLWRVLSLDITLLEVSRLLFH